MIWKPGELQSVYHELRFYVKFSVHKSFEILLINISAVGLSTLASQRYWTIASLYQKFIVFTVHKSA